METVERGVNDSNGGQPTEKDGVRNCDKVCIQVKENEDSE